MSVLSIAHLQAMLMPHLGRFSRSIWPIEEMYEQIPAELRLRYHNNAHAATMHAFMCSLARTEFTGVEGVQLSDDLNGSLHVLIDGTESGLGGTAVCRFKKLDGKYHSANYPTDRQKLMKGNMALPGLPEAATYVDLGYAMTDAGAIQAVYAVRLFDSKLILSIPKDLATPLPQPQTLPFEPVNGRLFSLTERSKSERPVGR